MHILCASLIQAFYHQVNGTTRLEPLCTVATLGSLFLVLKILFASLPLSWVGSPVFRY